MAAIELKRCRHCVRTLVSLQVDERGDFALRSPAIVCDRCDARASDEPPVYVPDDWE
jgi:hypothetical protein